MTNTHTIVYADPKVYAGWPANHGAWQWGDEFLVGFLRGAYKRKSMHNIAEPFEKMLARSLDGGKTWTVEKPNVDFECIAPTAPPAFDLKDSIIRVCGVYDHGGDECYEPGGFYLSSDRGKTWSGPYFFRGLEAQLGGDMICTARTRVHEGLLYLSAGQRDVWGTDYTFCASMRSTSTGEFFKLKSVVLEDKARAVMPAVARSGDHLVAVMRRRKSGVRGGWIEACVSDDDGATWCSTGMVGDTGSHNGNPPALIEFGQGRLCCTFANRDFGSIVCAVSDDQGKSWKSSLVREGGGKAFLDVGYPQLLKRVDGTPVCIYYWADANRPQQHIVATSLSL